MLYVWFCEQKECILLKEHAVHLAGEPVEIIYRQSMLESSQHRGMYLLNLESAERAFCCVWIAYAGRSLSLFHVQLLWVEGGLARARVVEQQPAASSHRGAPHVPLQLQWDMSPCPETICPVSVLKRHA